LEVVGEGVEERGELLGVFAEEGELGVEDGLGTDAVLEGVLGGTGLALGGARAGGELGIAAVGFDLSFGGHSGTSSWF
jgi:hypothetical protein